MTTVDLFANGQTASEQAMASPLVTATQAEPSFEDQLAADLNRAYDSVLAEHDERKQRAQAIRARIQETAGVADDMVLAALPTAEFDAVAVAERIYTALTDGRGRAFLGLNFDCELDDYALRKQFIEPIEEFERTKRYRVRHQSDDEFQVLLNSPPPRLDIRGLIANLQAKYGGDEGRAVRLRQVIDRLFTALRLGGADFEVVHGKVSLHMNAWGATIGRGFSRETQERLYHFAVGIEEMLTERDEVLPAGLHDFKIRGIDQAVPGSKFEISPEVSLRFFKGHIKIFMTAAFAEKLREFIAEFRR